MILEAHLGHWDVVITLAILLSFVLLELVAACAEVTAIAAAVVVAV